MTPTIWFDAQHTHAAAGVFILTPEGKAILQLRDDIPNIDNPGRITPFGGAAEHGETPIQCALRELAEETGLEPGPARLRYLGEVSKIDFRGKNTACVFYLLRDVDPDSLTVTEGTAILLSLAQIAADARVTPFCREMAVRVGRLPPE